MLNLIYIIPFYAAPHFEHLVVFIEEVVKQYTAVNYAAVGVLDRVDVQFAIARAEKIIQVNGFSER